MPFLTIGVEHSTAPLTIREAVAMDPEAIVRASTELSRHPGIAEVAILSTCNRTEIYLFAVDVATAATAATAQLTGTPEHLSPYLQTREEMDAAEHLFRVAAGLESQALGEGQILAQVRDALTVAQEMGTIGPNLHSLFRSAIACGRRARAGTALGRVDNSLGMDAIAAAEATLGPLRELSALVIGGGEMSRLVAAELRARSIGTLFIANRTATVAAELAARYGGQPARLADIPRLLPHVDLVISATAAPYFVVVSDDLPSDLARRDRPLQIFDLAIPRDVDPSIADMAGVQVHDLDSLLPHGLRENWAGDIASMEAVIAAELKEFSIWYQTRRVAPVIASLRAHVEAVSEAELRRVAPQLKDLTERERAAVDSLTGRLIDKMFHHLVTRLRLAAQSDPVLVEAAEFFFLHGEGGLFEHAAQTENQHLDAREARLDAGQQHPDVPAARAEERE